MKQIKKSIYQATCTWAASDQGDESPESGGSVGG